MWSCEVRQVSIVAFAQTRHTGHDTGLAEPELILPVIEEVKERTGLKRFGFTCSGSCDYLAGAPFSFVSALDAVGAWPPISESHVEMDGAWALYEAWVRLQHGDVDVALVFASGLSSRGDLREVLCLQSDPYYLMPLWAQPVSLAALQARAVLDAGLAEEADLSAVASRCRRAAAGNPVAQISGDVSVDELMAQPYLVSPLRPSDCPPVTDGAAAVVLAAGDRAR